MSDARTIECPLAADGRPIVPGEELYGPGGAAWEITAVGPRFSYGASELWPDRPDRRLRNEWLTHEQPDSWERLLADLRAPCSRASVVCAYFGRATSMDCAGCAAGGRDGCLHDLMLDVARRVEALRKAGGAR